MVIRKRKIIEVLILSLLSKCLRMIFKMFKNKNPILRQRRSFEVNNSEDDFTFAKSTHYH